MSPEEYGIPDYMVGGLLRYIQHGINPGSFLSAVLCNDLREAVGRADDTNRHRLPAYVMYLYSAAPAPCWGSPEKVGAWIKRHEQARAEAQGSSSMSAQDNGAFVDQEFFDTASEHRAIRDDNNKMDLDQQQQQQRTAGVLALQAIKAMNALDNFAGWHPRYAAAAALARQAIALSEGRAP